MPRYIYIGGCIFVAWIIISIFTLFNVDNPIVHLPMMEQSLHIRYDESSKNLSMAWIQLYNELRAQNIFNRSNDMLIYIRQMCIKDGQFDPRCLTLPHLRKPKRPFRNVISYSLYCTPRKHFSLFVEGLIASIRGNAIIYPTWTNLVYISDTIPKSIRTKIQSEHNVELRVKKFNPERPHYAMTWRFRVADDPTFDRFLIRDADSRPSIRELVTIMDWIESDAWMHGIRDHVQHRTSIMGGLWGGKTGMISMATHNQHTMTSLLDAFLETDVYASMGTMDQTFLHDIIYPIMKPYLVVHDLHLEMRSHLCQDTDCRPIPHGEIYPFEMPDGDLGGYGFMGSVYGAERTLHCTCINKAFDAQLNQTVECLDTRWVDDI